MSDGESEQSVLLEIKGLKVDYAVAPEPVHAVDGADLTVRRGEAIGIAGESGSGKSTMAMAVTRLLRAPATIVAGQVWYHEPLPSGGSKPPVDVLSMNRRELQQFRWQHVAIVLQSAMNALNPVLSVRAQLTDVLKTHDRSLDRDARHERAADLLETVGVNPDRLRSYAHELSGGMRQRVMIAMALALRPQLMVMDEPTTALDVVTQRQIMTELASLRQRFGFAMVFITHDLSLLLEAADTIAVMYAGRLVECATAEQVYRSPAHPYTSGLLNSFPPLSGPRRQLIGIPGSPPSLRNIPPGCSFAARCSHVTERCRAARPPLEAPPADLVSGRRVACHHDRLSAAASNEVTG